METPGKNVELIHTYFNDFTPLQDKQFSQLFEVYSFWNSKINVISRKDIDSMYLHHVLHSLSIAAITEFKAGMQIIDIGCGGGFPGVPLAIFFPEVEFLLVDSIAKKLKVVQEVCETLGIKNIQTKHTRVEEIKTRKFDFAVSRAVAPLNNLWQWAKPIIQPKKTTNLANGLICLKGGDLAQEISESGLRPRAYPIQEIFKESYFETKYVLHVAR